MQEQSSLSAKPLLQQYLYSSYYSTIVKNTGVPKMKKILTILLIAFFAVSGIKIGNFYFEDTRDNPYFMENLALINVANIGKHAQNDIRVRLFALDDADIFVSQRFDLSKGDIASVKFFLPLDLSGWVKIVVSNDDMKNTKYVYI